MSNIPTKEVEDGTFACREWIGKRTGHWLTYDQCSELIAHIRSRETEAPAAPVTREEIEIAIIPTSEHHVTKANRSFAAARVMALLSSRSAPAAAWDVEAVAKRARLWMWENIGEQWGEKELRAFVNDLTTTFTPPAAAVAASTPPVGMTLHPDDAIRLEQIRPIVTQGNEYFRRATVSDLIAIIDRLTGAATTPSPTTRTPGTIEVCERNALEACRDYVGLHDKEIAKKGCRVFACPLKAAPPSAPSPMKVTREELARILCESATRRGTQSFDFNWQYYSPCYLYDADAILARIGERGLLHQGEGR